jgi:hypothetical protein
VINANLINVLKIGVKMNQKSKGWFGFPETWWFNKGIFSNNRRYRIQAVVISISCIIIALSLYIIWR